MTDVVVSGGGPAGALTALLLARAGVRVRVFDRARFPRPKLCGDTLNPGALRLLERHMSTAWIRRHSLRIDGMVLTGPRGVTIHGVYGDGVAGRAITRHNLDQWLLDQARQAGAEIEERVTVMSAERDAHGAVTGVQVRGARGIVRQPARLVVAADGRHSQLAFALDLARHPARPRRWAVGAYFDNVYRDSSRGEMHVRADHYLGLAPVANGLTNACAVLPQQLARRFSHATTGEGPSTGLRAGPRWSDTAALLRSLIDRDAALRERFVDARLVDGPVILGPLAVDACGDGVPGLLLAGDAAGFIDPITGDGLRLAFESAELAASAALDILDGHLSPIAAIERLRVARRRAFRAKHVFNRTIRAVVGSSLGVTGATTVARVIPGLFEFIIRYAGDTPGTVWSGSSAAVSTERPTNLG